MPYLEFLRTSLFQWYQLPIQLGIYLMAFFQNRHNGVPFLGAVWASAVMTAFAYVMATTIVYWVKKLWDQYSANR